MFDVHEPSTFCNGIFLLMTIVMAFLGAGGVDDAGSYALWAGVWILLVYLNGFQLLGHVVNLEEELAAPKESLQEMRDVATNFPLMGLLPFLFVMSR